MQDGNEIFVLALDLQSIRVKLGCLTAVAVPGIQTWLCRSCLRFKRSDFSRNNKGYRNGKGYKIFQKAQSAFLGRWVVSRSSASDAPLDGIRDVVLL